MFSSGLNTGLGTPKGGDAKSSSRAGGDWIKTSTDSSTLVKIGAFAGAVVSIYTLYKIVRGKK